MDNEKAKTICKLGKGSECCKFLVCGPGGFECAKLTSMRKHIEDRTNMNAKGDNCEGE